MPRRQYTWSMDDDGEKLREYIRETNGAEDWVHVHFDVHELLTSMSETLAEHAFTYDTGANTTVYYPIDKAPEFVRAWATACLMGVTNPAMKARDAVTSGGNDEIT